MKKIIVFCLALLMATGLSMSVTGSSHVSAVNLVDAAKCQNNDKGAVCPTSCPDSASGATSTDPNCAAARDCRSLDSGCNVAAKYLNPLINAIGVLAGVAIVIGIVVGGIEYASSGGDPQKAATGKKHIKSSIIALVGFLFLYAFLSFLVPGGLGR